MGNVVFGFFWRKENKAKITILENYMHRARARRARALAPRATVGGMSQL
jgi:hypothetical protein